MCHLATFRETYSYFNTINVIPVDSFHDLPRIRNKEWNNVSVPYSLFYKIDVSPERQLRKLHVSTGTSAALTRII